MKCELPVTLLWLFRYCSIRIGMFFVGKKCICPFLNTRGGVEACSQADEIFAHNNKALPDGRVVSLYRQFPDCRTSSTSSSPKIPQHNLRRRGRQGTMSSIFLMGTGGVTKTRRVWFCLSRSAPWLASMCVRVWRLSKTPSQSIENLWHGSWLLGYDCNTKTKLASYSLLHIHKQIMQIWLIISDF